MASVMSDRFSWLFGHRSYDDMLQHWNTAGGPFKDGLNGPMKYVASSDHDTVLPWPNSSLLTGDVPGAVAELKERSPENLIVLGSGELVHSLLPHRLIDEFLLLIHPILLGSGLKLFPEEGAMRRLEMLSATSTDTGILVARYRSF
jgi:dihydrofolate reductase